MEKTAKSLYCIYSLLIVIVESQGQSGSSQVTFTIEAYKFQKEWTFTTSKLSGCLLKEINTTVLGFICSEKPSKTEMLKAWGSLENGTSGLEYMHLSCNLDSSLEESCVCGQLRLSEELDTTLNISRVSQVSSYIAQDIGYTYETWSCSHNTYITYEELESFSQATVVSLASPSIHYYSLLSMDTDNSDAIAFQKAELLIVNNGLSMDIFAFGHTGLCAMDNLQTIVVQNSINSQQFPTEWFVPDIPAKPGCFKVQRIQVLHNWIKSLQETILPSVNWLRSLQLRHNSIETVHERAFHGLTYLQELSLQNNSISLLPSDVFQPLIYINFIDLSLTDCTHSMPHLLGTLLHLFIWSLLTTCFTP